MYVSLSRLTLAIGNVSLERLTYDWQCQPGKADVQQFLRRGEGGRRAGHDDLVAEGSWIIMSAISECWSR